MCINCEENPAGEGAFCADCKYRDVECINEDGKLAPDAHYLAMNLRRFCKNIKFRGTSKTMDNTYAIRLHTLAPGRGAQSKHDTQANCIMAR